MRLTVVGCSGSIPGPDSPSSCYLLEADGHRVVLDLGSGGLGALQRYVDLDAVDAVLLSHLHPDHCADMSPYFVARRYSPGGPRPPLTVYGPRGVAERLAVAYGPSAVAGMREAFEVREWRVGSTYAVGPLRVRVGHMNHPIETLGMRIEHTGRVLAYSADTGVSDTLVDLARDTDLLLCEASFHEGRDSTPDLHLSGRGAAEHATRAGARRLVLTHLPPWNDPARTLAEARPAYDGPLEVARSGATYDV